MPLKQTLLQPNWNKYDFSEFQLTSMMVLSLLQFEKVREWLADWLAGWFAGWLAGRLACQSAGWWAHQLAG